MFSLVAPGILFLPSSSNCSSFAPNGIYLSESIPVSGITMMLALCARGCNRGRVAPTTFVSWSLYGDQREPCCQWRISPNTKEMIECLTSSANYSGWILYRARQACTSYVVLYALVDLRIVEVGNAHVHLVGSTKEFSYCRLWVGCEPNPEMARNLPTVEKMGG